MPAAAVHSLESDNDRGLRAAIEADPLGRAALDQLRADPWARARDIVVIDLGLEPVPGRPVLDSTDFTVEWSEIPRLSDLVGPRSEPTTPAGPGILDPHEWRVVVVLDDAAEPGECSAEVALPDGARQRAARGPSNDLRISWGAPGDANFAITARGFPRCRGDEAYVEARHTEDIPLRTTVDLVLESGIPHRVALRRPVVERVDSSELTFARDSCVLAPLDASCSHLLPLALAIVALAHRPAHALLVAGHASPDGAEGSNSALALRRAQAVRFLMTSDRDAWVGLVAQHGSPSDVQRLLSYLHASRGWFTAPGRTDGIVDDQTDAAVLSFQRQYNLIYDGVLDEDGVCGTETLGALFDCQTAELHNLVEAMGGSTSQLVWRGGGGTLSAAAEVQEHPAFSGSATPVGQRRVDLLLVPDSLPSGWTEQAQPFYDATRFLPLATTVTLSVEIRIFDVKGEAMPNAPYQIQISGSVIAGTSDATGRVRVEVPAGATHCWLEWGALESLRNEFIHLLETGAEPGQRFEYAQLVFLDFALVDDGESGRRESSRRALHNIGYTGPDLAGAACRFQSDNCKEITGRIGELRDEVVLRNSEGSPDG